MAFAVPANTSDPRGFLVTQRPEAASYCWRRVSADRRAIRGLSTFPDLVGPGDDGADHD